MSDSETKNGSSLTSSESQQTEDSDEESSSSEHSEECKAVFTRKCKLITERKVTQRYILHLHATLETEPSVVIGTTDSVSVYDLTDSRFEKLDDLVSTDEQCVGVKFNSLSNDLLHVAYKNSNIKLWDLRDTRKPVTKFTDTTWVKGTNKKQFSCFDFSPDDRLLCAGTEVFEGEAFLLFWDIRNAKLLGGYWQAHTDVITALKYHPIEKNSLMSASTDGLINIYDLEEQNEDDALQDTLNTESSVEQIAWVKKASRDAVICSTHTHDIQLWNLEEAQPYVQFKRDKLEKLNENGHSYIAGLHADATKQKPLVLLSSFKTETYLRGVTIISDALVPLYNFEENTQRVRASFFNENTNVLITGGEKGILNAWELAADDDESTSS